jgi:hypothetical protein
MLVQFVEDFSGFSTSEVRDAAGDILQFSRSGDLIWPVALEFPAIRRRVRRQSRLMPCASAGSKFGSEPTRENGGLT